MQMPYIVICISATIIRIVAIDTIVIRIQAVI